MMRFFILFYFFQNGFGRCDSLTRKKTRQIKTNSITLPSLLFSSLLSVTSSTDATQCHRYIDSDVSSFDTTVLQQPIQAPCASLQYSYIYIYRYTVEIKFNVDDPLSPLSISYMHRIPFVVPHRYIHLHSATSTTPTVIHRHTHTHTNVLILTMMMMND